MSVLKEKRQFKMKNVSLKEKCNFKRKMSV